MYLYSTKILHVKNNRIASTDLDRSAHARQEGRVFLYLHNFSSKSIIIPHPHPHPSPSIPTPDPHPPPTIPTHPNHPTPPHPTPPPTTPTTPHPTPTPPHHPPPEPPPPHPPPYPQRLLDKLNANHLSQLQIKVHLHSTQYFWSWRCHCTWLTVTLSPHIVRPKENISSGHRLSGQRSNRI